MVGRFRGWDQVTIPDDRGIFRQAAAPVIVSASRATDIPAFFGDWFVHRLSCGYTAWINPWSGKRSYVSFSKARAFVFWSKNPQPFMKYLPILDRMKMPYYFLYTLNDYGPEGLEPRIPPLTDRVRTFCDLSGQIGKGRVVWRFDPLILSGTLGVDELLSRVEHLGSRLRHHTKRLVISFIDIEKYQRVRRALMAGECQGAREFSRKEIAGFCSGLEDINEAWGLSISACGENEDLSCYGVARGQCISGDLLREEFSHDRELMAFLGDREQSGIQMPYRHLKDPGQRGACGCIASKDIGQYSTCMHLCRYCYANAGRHAVEENYSRYLSLAQDGIFTESITGAREGI